MATPTSSITAEKHISAEESRAGTFPPAKPGGPRLISLDAFRGFIMFWIVGGGGLMLGIQRLGHNRVFDGIVRQLNHTPWEGLRFYDCIWPSFMFMVGVSLAFSFAKRAKTQSPREMTWHALKRFAIIFLLGSLRESVFLGSPYLIELSSALQPIAVAYLATYFLMRKAPWFQAAVAGSIWVGYALLLAFVPGPGVPAGSYAYNHNLVNAVDLALLRDHWMKWPYAVEGWGTVLSTIPTISTTIFGALAAALLQSSRPALWKMKVLGAAGIGGLILGYAISPFVPVVMKIWTTSYGVLSAAWACLMFLVFYFVIDFLGYRKWAFPFVVIGMNALAAYLAETFTRLSQIIEILTSGIVPALGLSGPLFKAVSFLAVEWGILYWMYKRKIFLTP